VKILVFSWRDLRHPQAGGSEVYLHEQSKFWVEWGSAVDWIVPRFPGAPRTETIDGIGIHRRGGRLSVYARAIGQYRRIGRPDVIVDVENGIPFFTPLYAGAPTALVIHHIHTDVWRRELPRPAAELGLFLERRVMPAVYRRRPIVTVSESSAAMVRELFPDNEIHIVHNGVSAGLRPGTKSERPEIVFLGRLKRYKSIEVLLEALARLSRPDLRLHIIGRGDDESRLRRKAGDLGLSNVHFLGHVDEDRKRELLQRAWLAVNPSAMEGWGITNIEANACGTPVVGSDVPGIRDSILENRSGLLFPYGNVGELAGKIDFLIANAAERARLSREAVDWAARFTWRAAAEKTYALLTSIAAPRPNAGRRLRGTLSA
jgi:glycosyltransferase involved in cell wall biosynthesis